MQSHTFNMEYSSKQGFESAVAILDTTKLFLDNFVQKTPL